MLSLRRSLILSIAAAALLVPPATAPAATTAERFAGAVERGKSAIRAKEAEYRAAFEAVDFDRCERALERKPPPKREADRFGLLFAAVILQPTFGPTKPVLQQIVDDLDAIPTRDPILRSGRAAWRSVVGLVSRFPTVDKPCEQIEAWANAGWRASARPDFDFEGFEKLLEEGDDKALERKLDRAARRLRQLGVSKGAAERFAGETLLEDIPDEVTGLGSDEDVPEIGVESTPAA
jgi:hypothetical protein